MDSDKRSSTFLHGYTGDADGKPRADIKVHGNLMGMVRLHNFEAT
jgi:hypothetical protein